MMMAGLDNNHGADLDKNINFLFRNQSCVSYYDMFLFPTWTAPRAIASQLNASTEIVCQ